jgi:hypothetical protein
VTVSKFDRLRPRTGADAQPAALTPDSEGKRALFSSTDAGSPSGAILLDCSRCGRVTSLTPTAALRAAFPALHLSVVVGWGSRETTIGLLRRDKPGSWMRCPACGRGAWVRVTVRL